MQGALFVNSGHIYCRFLFHFHFCLRYPAGSTNCLKLNPYNAAMSLSLKELLQSCTFVLVKAVSGTVTNRNCVNAAEN